MIWNNPKIESLHPVAALFYLRSDQELFFSTNATTGDLNLLYYSLPKFEKNDILKLSTFYNSGGDFRRGLLDIKFSFSFSKSFVSTFAQNLKNLMQITNDQIIHFFFHCLSWYCLDTDQKLQDDFLNIVNSINHIVSLSVSKFCASIFVPISIDAINNEEFQWNEDMIATCTTQYLLNKDLGSESFAFLLGLLEISSLKNSKNTVTCVLKTVSSLFEGNRKVVSSPFIKDIIPIIQPLFNIFDPCVYDIVSTASHDFGEFEMMFNDICTSIISKLTKVVQKINPKLFILDVDTILGKTTERIGFRDGIKSIHLETNEYSKEIMAFFSEDTLSILSLIIRALRQASLKAIDVFINSIIDWIPVVDPEISPNFFAIIELLLPELSKSKIYNKLILNLFSSRIFHSSLTVYLVFPLPHVVEILRSHLYSTVCNSKPEILGQVLGSCPNNYFCFAENVARVYQIADRIGIELFACDLVFTQLFGAATNFREEETRAQNKSIYYYAQSTIFLFIFELLNNSRTSLLCLSSQLFMGGLVTFLFESELSNIILERLSLALSYTSHLPRIFLDTASTIFKTCGSKPSDCGFTDLAIRFSSIFISSMKNNPQLLPSALFCLDDLMFCSSKILNWKLFYSCFDLIGLFFHQTIMNSLSPTQFDALVYMFRRISNNDTYETILIKMLCIVGDSFSTSIDTLFLIKNPSFLVLSILCFSETKFFGRFLKVLMALCVYSESNCYSCHQEGIDYLLLEIIEGNVCFLNNYYHPTKLNQDEIGSIFEILRYISIIKSSESVLFKLYSMLSPTFKYNTEVLSMVQSVLNERLPANPCYSVLTTKPLAKHQVIMDLNTPNFFISMSLKIDIKTFEEKNIRAKIISVKDSQSLSLSVYFQQRSFYVITEGPRIRSSLPLGPIQSSSVFLTYIFNFIDEGDFYSVNLLQEGNLVETGNVRKPIFCSNLTFEIGSLVSNTPRFDSPVPLYIGPFSINCCELIEEYLGELSPHGFKCENCLALSWKQIPHVFANEMDNLYHVFRRSSIVQLVLSFGQIYDSSQLVMLDLFFSILSHCNVAQFADEVTICSIKYLSRKANPNIEEVFKEFFNEGIKFFVEYERELSVFDFSYFFYILALNKKILSYHTYISFYNFYIKCMDSELSSYIFNTFVFNLYIWSNLFESEFTQLLNHWRKYLIMGDFPKISGESTIYRFVEQSYYIYKQKQMLWLLLSDHFNFFVNFFISIIPSSKEISQLAFILSDNNDFEFQRRILMILLNISSKKECKNLFSTDVCQSIISSFVWVHEINNVLDIFINIGSTLSLGYLAGLYLWHIQDFQLVSVQKSIVSICIQGLVLNDHNYLKGISNVSRSFEDRLWFLWPILSVFTFPEEESKIIEWIIKELNTVDELMSTIFLIFELLVYLATLFHSFYDLLIVIIVQLSHEIESNLLLRNKINIIELFNYIIICIYYEVNNIDCIPSIFSINFDNKSETVEISLPIYELISKIRPLNSRQKVWYSSRNAYNATLSSVVFPSLRIIFQFFPKDSKDFSTYHTFLFLKEKTTECFITLNSVFDSLCARTLVDFGKSVQHVSESVYQIISLSIPKQNLLNEHQPYHFDFTTLYQYISFGHYYQDICTKSLTLSKIPQLVYSPIYNLIKEATVEAPYPKTEEFSVTKIYNDPKVLFCGQCQLRNGFDCGDCVFVYCSNSLFLFSSQIKYCIHTVLINMILLVSDYQIIVFVSHSLFVLTIDDSIFELFITTSRNLGIPLYDISNFENRMASLMKIRNTEIEDKILIEEIIELGKNPSLLSLSTEVPHYVSEIILPLRILSTMSIEPPKLYHFISCNYLFLLFNDSSYQYIKIANGKPKFFTKRIKFDLNQNVIPLPLSKHMIIYDLDSSLCHYMSYDKYFILPFYSINKIIGFYDDIVVSHTQRTIFINGMTICNTKSPIFLSKYSYNLNLAIFMTQSGEILLLDPSQSITFTICSVPIEDVLFIDICECKLIILCYKNHIKIVSLNGNEFRTISVTDTVSSLSCGHHHVYYILKSSQIYCSNIISGHSFLLYNDQQETIIGTNYYDRILCYITSAGNIKTIKIVQ